MLILTSKILEITEQPEITHGSKELTVLSQGTRHSVQHPHQKMQLIALSQNSTPACHYQLHPSITPV